jgi:GWxTD domain-containing protein
MKRAGARLMKNAILLIIPLIGTIGCSSIMEMRKDPFYETFLEKTSLIMTKEEIEVYKHLPDKESKEEFIEEFWQIRDPDPGTVENEAKTEFEERVDYANKWFGLWNPDRGKEAETMGYSKTGWNSDRGRIHIILGPPDTIIFDGLEITDGTRDWRKANQWRQEAWYYNRYSLRIFFYRAMGGRWVMNTYTPGLYEALESAKLNWAGPTYTEDIERRFRFDSKFENDTIVIIIPLERITFDRELTAKFKIKINIYHNNKKIDEINETKTLEESEEDLLERDNIFFNFPYSPTVQGEYLFDIIIEDLMAMYISKHRSSIKYKFKD